MRVGNIRFNEQNVLGKGCRETIVFQGSFEKREVAVKRIVLNRRITEELAIRQKCNGHENMVRYYCTELDQEFHYIAIELCAATLQHYVEGKDPPIVGASMVPVSELRHKISPLEILRQTTNGLMHLHGLNIVHDAIKPQNILLSLPDNLGCVRVKISGFGPSILLRNSNETFPRYSDSKGRIDPHMELCQRIAMSDILSLGCVFYYVLSNGFHPFPYHHSGVVWKRAKHFGEFNLGRLRRKNTPPDNQTVLAEQIIRDMIQRDMSKPLSTRAIANHPLFWDNDRVLAFLLKVSDRVEKLEIMAEPLCSLEKNARFVVRDDWMYHLDTGLTEDLRRSKFRRYYGCSKSHYLELTPELQKALGTIPHEFTNYWISRFPHLLSHSYHALANNSGEPIFRQYYNDEEDNHTSGGPQVWPHIRYKFTKPAYFHRDDNDNDELKHYYELEQDMKTSTETGTATEPGGGSYSETIDLGDGEMRVGNIRFNEQNELGKGCEETVVFLGSFGGRKAAVKRISAHRFTLADREVKRLCESDAHENVIRYYGTEQDRQFRYIAIELCAGTLEDYVTELSKAPSAILEATTETVSLRDKISPQEIMHQATKGMAHLHGLGIVHRDVKPQNILLSLPDNRGCVLVKISDFGLSKKLNNGKESFSQNSGVTGTYGWQAPEMQPDLRATTSVDIFSLGCVFYYVLSDGFHPFGDNLKRQANILSGEYDLGMLRRENPLPDNRTVLAEEIIRDMIQSDASKRPSARAIANHPLLWHNKRVLEFLQDVSNWLKGLKNMTEPLRWLEKNASLVVRDDWIHHLDAVMNDGLCNVATGGFIRGYKKDRVQDLLRCIRNHINHYNELTPEIQRALGTMPHEFTKYWISRFPRLLSHAYHAMANNSREPIFRQYYNDKEDNNTGGRSPVGPHRGYKFTPPAYFHEDDKDNDELTNERVTDMKKGNKSPSDGGSAEARNMPTGSHKKKRGTYNFGKTMSGRFITRQQVRENDSGALDDQRASVQGADAGGENDAISDGGVNHRRRYVTATGPGNLNSTSVTTANQNNTGKRRRKRKSKAK
ncbi:uncharacterized protein LOC128274834 [Anopheles cruzii]|uniref:uncharacterized protein LOC128274834 n=1 Tax=Anopheles cruzii TaxID=68878 RepID=UPI0022EC21CE|nr:uncharacterized protein LOC128274834 [Anopheles cruzii]